jgi:hypothetical protein
MGPIRKYPRTPHLEGSRLQPGDEDLDSVPFRQVAGRYLVVEEKLDGANAGISFDAHGRLWLQSRGHYLTGGPREKHFNLFKQWAHALATDLYDILGCRYVLYGEWLYARHTVFYNRLPHYFHEFDVLDTETGTFLSTARRRKLLELLPIVPVPVLHEGPARSPEQLTALIVPSRYKDAHWREELRALASARGLDPERVLEESDSSDLMEGLYLKVEEDGVVVERYKYVRPGFLTAILDAGTHWLRRPIVPNQLQPGVQLFSSFPENPSSVKLETQTPRSK